MIQIKPLARSNKDKILFPFEDKVRRNPGQGRFLLYNQE